MNVIKFFSLVDTQARLSLKAEASRFYLSYLWWVLEPLLFVLVFYVVFSVILTSRTENFLLFLICGKIPFLWFSKSVTAASNSIVQNKGLISQLDIPKALFPYGAVQEALYKQWPVFGVLLGVVVAYGLLPEVNWFWLLPLIIVQYLLILLCSLVGALLVSFIADMRILINMGMIFLLFCSGIFWDIRSIENIELQQLMLVINPLLFLIDSYREVLINRSVYSLEHLLWLCGFVLIGLMLAHWLMSKMSRHISARVLAT